METVAEKICTIQNYTAALIEADKKAIDAEQDYEAETTVFLFEDGSKIKFDAVAQSCEIVDC